MICRKRQRIGIGRNTPYANNSISFVYYVVICKASEAILDFHCNLCYNEFTSKNLGSGTMPESRSYRHIQCLICYDYKQYYKYLRSALQRYNRNSETHICKALSEPVARSLSWLLIVYHKKSHIQLLLNSIFQFLNCFIHRR